MSTFQNKTQIYKTIILPAILYCCKMLYITLRKEYKLQIFQKKVLWKISEPERDKQSG